MSTTASTATDHETDILAGLDFAPRCESTRGCDALATHFIELEAIRRFKTRPTGRLIQPGDRLSGVLCRPHVDRELSLPNFNTYLRVLRLEPLR